MFKRDNVFNKSMVREAILLFVAIAFYGLAQGFSENTWNNFFQVVGVTTQTRTLIEPIREVPGLLIVLIVAVLSFLTIGRIGAVAMVTRAAGLLLIGLTTKTFSPSLVAFIVVVSLGDHLFMPLRNSLGITVANHGSEGRVIGFMDAVSVVTYTAASLPILLWFSGKQIGDYRILFLLSSGAALLAGVAFFLMRTRRAQDSISKPRLVFKKKFALYYIISFISGLRKQIFLVFAPWLLVQSFHQGLKTMTLLNIVGSVIVFFFNPFIGRMIDRHGERKLLVGGGIVCTMLYGGYALLCNQTSSAVIAFVLLGFGLLDKMTQSTLMGRDIFVKHTASSPDEIMPTLSVGVSMDHIASVTAPFFGGLLWTAVGPQWVFVAGVVIGAVYTAMCLLVPNKKVPVESAPALISD